MAITRSVKKIPVTTDIPKVTKTASSAALLSVEDLIGAPKKPEEISAPTKEPVLPAPAYAVRQAGLSPKPVVPEITDKPTVERIMTTKTPPVISARPYIRRQIMRPNMPATGYNQGFNQPVYNNQYNTTPYNNNPYNNSGYSTYRPYRNRDNYNNGQMPDNDVPTLEVKGFLEIMPEGHGFLRPKFIPSDKDIYISQSQIRKFSLRGGDEVAGMAREPKENERYYGLLKVVKVNEVEVEKMVIPRPRYDDLVPIYPKEMIRLETEKLPLSTRIIDLLAPIGFGQRGMIVSPPKAGKTTVLKEIANGITTNYPKAHLMAALIGERPEEVTDLSRSIKGEVIASHFDESPQQQTKVAEIALDRAKRQVELGKDVIILLDSVTRLARAYNLTVNSSGRTLSGGFDPAALYPAKKFLGAARKCEGGGSLTIIGTALVETGSRMDDLIYEEFKGTGNMELHLSRALAERRVFPAIDVQKSGTRQEQLLLDEKKLKQVVTLRNMLALLHDEAEQTMAIIDKLNKTKNNKEFLDSLSKGG